ncbi:Uncharacterized protein Fot_00770 [Forsythia ovata]|uniref:Bifunctional inhibitor/plant lipid transfer protein/seed storage helical domain-containing protein n=1 Tax=Forsythia ovata TaxID=205694 RepID=A0ABD1X220_9LAMI
MAAMKSVFSLSFCSKWLVVVLMALVLQNKMAQSQAQTCSNSLANLNVCAPFVVPGVANTSPTPDCCTALQGLEHDCICNTLRIAARLPAQCNLPSLSCGAWLLLNLIFWAHLGVPAWGKHKWRKSKTTSKSIPYPKGFPIIGNMKLMAGLAHRRIAAMTETCQAKRLMAFSLDETRVIVTCKPDVAKEILKSSVFADRLVKESAYNLLFNRAIGFAPYGVYWRTLKRIATTHTSLLS